METAKFINLLHKVLDDVAGLMSKKPDPSQYSHEDLFKIFQLASFKLINLKRILGEISWASLHFTTEEDDAADVVARRRRDLVTSLLEGLNACTSLSAVHKESFDKAHSDVHKFVVCLRDLDLGDSMFFPSSEFTPLTDLANSEKSWPESPCKLALAGLIGMVHSFLQVEYSSDIMRTHPDKRSRLSAKTLDDLIKNAIASAEVQGLQGQDESDQAVTPEHMAASICTGLTTSSTPLLKAWQVNPLPEDMPLAGHASWRLAASSVLLTDQHFRPLSKGSNASGMTLHSGVDEPDHSVFISCSQTAILLSHFERFYGVLVACNACNTEAL